MKLSPGLSPYISTHFFLAGEAGSSVFQRVRGLTWVDAVKMPWAVYLLSDSLRHAVQPAPDRGGEEEPVVWHGRPIALMRLWFCCYRGGFLLSFSRDGRDRLRGFFFIFFFISDSFTDSRIQLLIMTRFSKKKKKKRKRWPGGDVSQLEISRCFEKILCLHIIR